MGSMIIFTEILAISPSFSMVKFFPFSPSYDANTKKRCRVYEAFLRITEWGLLLIEGNTIEEIRNRRYCRKCLWNCLLAMIRFSCNLLFVL